MIGVIVILFILIYFGLAGYGMHIRRKKQERVLDEINASLKVNQDKSTT
jgi:Tfp pilus assembly protein FimT